MSKFENAGIMFGNAGMGEFYAHLAGVQNKVMVEYDSDRADIYKCIYPHCHVIPKDITQKETMDEFIEKCREFNVSLLMASPPCQGHSLANQSEDKDEDIRNRLILQVVEAIERYPFKRVMIENVPSFLDYSSDTILPELKGATIREYLGDFLSLRGYFANIYQYVDARKYSSTPQKRVRAIVLASKDREWKLPPMLPKEQWRTLEDAIGDLPSLEAGERGPGIYDVAPQWDERYINIMKHTPTGCSAFNNSPEFQPYRRDGKKSKFYRTSYVRPKWDGAFPCVLRGSAGMGGMITCHPGRYIGDDENGNPLYNNARAYTIHELLRSYDLPDDFPFPDWAIDEDDLLRDVLGEAFAPRLVQRILEVRPR